MVRNEFEILDFDTKEDYLFRNGEAIGSRYYNDNLYLFYVDGFFVEVSLNNLITHFDTIEIVDYEAIQQHYLHLIDISDVFKHE
jgi:hypothetical protein